MNNSRIVEEEGVFGEITAAQYDQLQKKLRDKGQLSTDAIIKSGISAGIALEIGPGPGYLGLEWLKKTAHTTLQAIDISSEMISLAQKNAQVYHLQNRVAYIHGQGQTLPFANDTFDAVFSNGSLHEWSKPERVLAEIHRVLKTSGKFFISDLRRDLDADTMKSLKAMVPEERWNGLIASTQSAYTINEAEEIFRKSPLHHFIAVKNMFSLEVTGEKQALI
jgi:ubiquinone/menaquinone biosynthesis C-methylase UbiE